MDSINWHSIRPYNNSQNFAFEELVCQLARDEKVNNGVTFQKLGTPDGGVEGYWTLKNGSEYAWQAKYFFSLGQSQWNQIEKSFKTAIKTHPKIKRYYIALPIDKPDSGIVGNKSLHKKWIAKLKNWKKYAISIGIKVDIIFWGSSELIHRLTLERHAGRRKWWFDVEDFSDDWFKKHLCDSVDKLGSRYTPELNISLDIAQAFDGLSRNMAFKERIKKSFYDVGLEYHDLINSFNGGVFQKNKTKIQNIYSNLKKVIEEKNFFQSLIIQFDLIDKCITEIESEISYCFEKINILQEKEKKKTKNTPETTYGEKYSLESHDLGKFRDRLNELYQLINSDQSILANRPILILTGEAGIGKSHLLADVATEMLKKNEFSLLLLGQHFVNDEDPWSQILKNILRLNCNESEFLGVLNSRAEITDSRIILFIDAINEGRGKYFWKTQIKSFIKTFAQFPNVGLVLSVRSSYEDYLLPDEEITVNLAHRIRHQGFTDVEFDATKKFFNHYEIKLPGVPLLHPEFQNPLFLKLFCSGLNKMGLHEIPDGYEGVSGIIDFYLTSVNETLSDRARLDYDKSINLVKKCVKLIASTIFESSDRWVTYEKAHDIIEPELRRLNPMKNRLLEELISEGVFSKNLFFSENSSDYLEGIYFGYERFGEYVIVNLLFEKHFGWEQYITKLSLSHISWLQKYLNRLIIQSLRFKFKHLEKLAKIVNHPRGVGYFAGLIEAFSVLLPEKVNVEFYEILPIVRKYPVTISAFIKSLIWRKTETVTHKLKQYINEVVLRSSKYEKQFLDTLLLISSNPKHPLNGDFLHRHLFNMSMGNRDGWWTIYINDNYQCQTAIKRIIDWAWSDNAKNYLSNESVKLICKTLGWFFTSSNRYLRDAATKASICLLTNRIDVIKSILQDFENINDPYVYDRLFAVAYGVVLRSENLDGLHQLSNYVHHTIFNKTEVYPHILLRDYARNIIEYAIHKGIQFEFEIKTIRPPYQSNFPTNFPTNEEIEALRIDYDSKAYKDSCWGQNAILNSMVTEYGRETGGYGDFGRYVFQSAFNDWRELKPQKLSNFATKRIFELGYNVLKHGQYDSNIYHNDYPGRSGHKIERIGKKYQWIAMHELLARVADKYKMTDSSDSNNKTKIYSQGPWDPYVRDIDPTIVIKKTKQEKWRPTTLHWWFNETVSDWGEENSKWLKKNNTIDPKKLIQVKDKAGIEWLILEMYPIWEEPTPKGIEKLSVQHKEIFYNVRSFLVHSERLRNLRQELLTTNFRGWHFPDCRHMYEFFSKEFFWSPAYGYFEKPYYGGGQWRTISKSSFEDNTEKVIVPVEQFLWEEEYDCSKEETINYFVPTKSVFEGMRMFFGKDDGEFVNNQGEIICFDPSVKHESISCLLIKKKDLMSYLSNNKLSIFWTTIGEKRIIGGKEKYGNSKFIRNFLGVYWLEKSKLKGKLRSYPEILHREKKVKGTNTIFSKVSLTKLKKKFLQKMMTT